MGPAIEGCFGSATGEGVDKNKKEDTDSDESNGERYRCVSIWECAQSTRRASANGGARWLRIDGRTGGRGTPL